MINRPKFHTLRFSKCLELGQNKKELDNTWKRLESNRNLDLTIYLQLTTVNHLENSGFPEAATISDNREVNFLT